MFSIANAIIAEDMNSVRQWMRHGMDVNQMDEYGFTPLIEAAIADNIEIAQYLLDHGAAPNMQDVTGGTALQWAVENNNLALAKLLLDHRADPNAYNLAGQPVLVMPTLRRQTEMRQLLVARGADEVFAQDYINTKLLGHVFELIGPATIVTPNNNFVEVDFEGFFLETTLGLVANSLDQFQNHFAARKLRRYLGISNLIVQTLLRAAQLIRFQQYRVDRQKAMPTIDALLQYDPLVIPVGYEGHAITFIKYGDIWVKCDRREDSRLYDNIMYYRVGNMNNLNNDLIKSLIYVKQDSEFINYELDRLLDLQPLTELKIEAQVSGNCSWANVEATIPALFFLVLMQFNHDSQALPYYKTLALNYFHRWRDWNRERLLDFCFQSYEKGDTLRKASKAEILAAILFQRSDLDNLTDRERIERILNLLINSPYHYILKNYLRVYYYESYTPEGKRFAELLKEYGYPK